MMAFDNITPIEINCVACNFLVWCESPKDISVVAV